MRVRDLAAAESDLDDALSYYADIDRGLAEALLREVVSAKNGIARLPEESRIGWPVSPIFIPFFAILCPRRIRRNLPDLAGD